MRKLPALLALLLLSSSTQATFPQAAEEEQAETRAYLQRYIKGKIEDEELIIIVAVMSDVEGNHATLYKLQDLQKYYQTHKPRNIYRLGWTSAKLAQYYLVKGQPDAASKEATKAMQILGRMPDPLYSDATHFYLDAIEALYPVLFKLKRTAEGTKIKQTFERDKRYLGTDEARLFMYAAWASVMLDDTDQAKGFCEESLKADPDFCAPFWVRALVQLDGGHVEKAKKELAIALEYCPNFASAYTLLGICELEQKNYNKAIEHLNRAITMDPTDDEAIAVRGIVKALNQDISGAVDDLGTVIKKMNRKSWVIYALRAECLLKQARYAESAADMTQAIALADKKSKKLRATMYWIRGAAHERMEKQNLALEDLNKAIELDPENKEMYKERGELRITLGDQMGVSDYDEYSKMCIAEENDTFVGQKGKSVIARFGVAKKKQVAEEKSGGKPSWISDGPSGSSSSSSSASAATKQARTVPEENIVKKPDETPATPAAPTDPYISYFQNKLIQVGTTKAGAPAEKGSVRIEADGVPTLIEKTDQNRGIQDLIMRAAPFKQPPADKPSTLQVEFDPSAGAVKVYYQN